MMQNPSFANSDDAETRAAEWLQRRHFWNWGKEDEAALEAWLAQSLTNRLAYWRLEAAWNRTERLAALRSTSIVEEAARTNKPAMRTVIGGIAAAFLMVALALGGYAHTFLVNRQTYETPLGGHRIVALADGSRIELNTETILRTEGRQAILERGEAYFQIKHDTAHPFVVLAGSHRITDLGTKFLVRRETGRLEVELTEGKARFDSVDAKSILLSPGDVVAVAGSSVFVTRKAPSELVNALAWRRGLLVFRYTPLEDAAAEFNRYNHEKLVIADASLAKRTIYGTFQADDVKLFARVARDVLGLRVDSRGGEIVISR